MSQQSSTGASGHPGSRLLRQRSLSVLAGLAALVLGLSGPGSAMAQIPGALNVSLSASPTTVQTGQPVHFELSASPPSVLGGRVDSIVLDYGDGDSSDIGGSSRAGERVTRSREHTYTAPGSYTAVLTATASNGESNTALQTITVSGGGTGPIGGLTVELTASPEVAQSGQLVTFRATASPPSVLGGTITGMTLDFGDGTSADLSGSAAAGERVTRTTTHSYTLTANYVASLTATASNGSAGSASRAVTVTGGGPLPPIGGLNVNLSASPQVVQTGQSITFNGTASPPSVLGGSITSMQLDFGDGVTADLGNGAPGEVLTRTTTHAYGVAGAYTAVLTATASNGATNSALQSISVLGSTPPPGPSTTVSLQPGWNLIASPNGATIPGPLGTLFTFQPGDTNYETVQNMQQGLGYWAFLNFPTTETIPLSGPQTFTKFIPASQWVMLGNPGSTVATVSGADIVYSYNAATNYTPTTTLQPGQGSWVLVNNGGIVTISSR